MNQAFRIGTGLSAQDEREIAAVLIAYASAIDQRDWRLLHSIFTYDCDVDYGSFGKWHGAKALTEHLKRSHAELGASLHRISNIGISALDGIVHARSYVDAVLTPMNPGGPLHHGVGYYDDQFTRSGNGWQIARRRFHAVLIE
ncbi:MAG: nuclear transport factor 2 family protein [Novosphingobium sp.]|nr:nuclear transport factor 2 family protein [Novosphingobium sp.]MCP5380150.1 nuclear transport factor 2 family protein [Novosphingobium sp.]MCP5388228.1 nuclear transport factor 2 family protein [Novosphingobium sp.]